MTGISSLFRPRSIAVVGASDRAGSRGAELLDNLRSVGYPGTVYPINPKRTSIGGRPAFARLTDIGAPVDAVAIGVDQKASRSAVSEAVRIGARAVLVLGTGYAEASAAGVRVQDEMAVECRQAGVTLVGPNCLGPWSRLDHVSYWLAPGSDLPLSGIGLVTQSGALASALMEPLSYRGIALDAVATTGNEADAGVADFVGFFGVDPRLRVVGLIVESVRRPAELLAAIRRTRAQGVAVICLLLGASAAGRRAAQAHTAALVGDAAVARSYLRQAGASVVGDLAELTEHLVLFSHYPRGLRAGVAVTTVSGGGSGLVADLAETAGLSLAEPEPATLERISTLLRGKPVTNPIDVALAGDVPGTYEESVALLAADANVGTVAIGLNVPHAFDESGAQFYAGQVRSARPVKELGKDAVAFAIVAGELSSAMQAAAADAGVPVLLGGRESLLAIAHAVEFDPAPLVPLPVGSALRPGGPTPTRPSEGVDEFDVRAQLATYGVPIAAEELATSAEQACAAADRIGYPVALKLAAAGLAHKSEHGAVRLGLRTPADVRESYAELVEVGRGLDGVAVRGVAVQEMVPAGTELILGALRDPIFGRALVLGWGGLWAEAYPAPRVGTLPISADEVDSLIAGLFAGAHERAAQLTPLDELRDTILAFAAYVADLPPDVAVVEINPLILGAARVLAVDAAVQLGGSQ